METDSGTRPKATLRTQIEAVLEEDEWTFQVEGSTIWLVISGEHARYEAHIETGDGEGRYFVYVRCPVLAPDHRRREVCEYLARANYRNAFGKLGLLMDTGSLYAEVGCPTGADGSFDPAVFRTLFRSVLSIMDEHMPKLLAVLFGGMTAEEAAQVPEAAA